MLGLVVGLLGCVTVDPQPRADPEICDDGIDNNGDGLIDCDDDACGGIQCREGSGPDTGASDEPVEIVIDNRKCCEFTFNEQNCSNLRAGTIDIVNRTDEDGAITYIRCDNTAEFGGVVSFRVLNSGETPVDILATTTVPAQSTITVEAVFDCEADAAFTATCEAKAAAGPFGDERGFIVRGALGL